MTHLRKLGYVVALITCFSSNANSAQVADEASAIRAAMIYTRDRCSNETPCTFRPKREEKLWSVRVQFTRSKAPGEKATPYPGGYVILYLDGEGKLVRRVDGE